MNGRGYDGAGQCMGGAKKGPMGVIGNSWAV